MRYYTEGKLSQNIHISPEGYLLCPAVAIARTGTLQYTASDIFEETEEPNILFDVTREEAELFSEKTIASFEGKPICIDHPEDFVNTQNYKKYAVGHLQNVRQGKGEKQDLLLADLFITDKTAITEVQKGLRELSCGYDAETEFTGKNKAKQHNIVGNHVALVEKGRCGSRCKINDSQQKRNKNMKSNWYDKIFKNPAVQKAIKDAENTVETKDEDANTSASQKDTDPIQGLLEKFDELTLLIRSALEAKPKENADEESEPIGDNACNTEDAENENIVDSEEIKTQDSTENEKSKVADSDTLSRARLLAPQYRFSIQDKAHFVKKTALKTACRDSAFSKSASAILGTQNLDSLKPETVHAAFMALSEVAKLSNNKRTTDSLSALKKQVADFGSVASVADINAKNREFYANINR